MWAFLTILGMVLVVLGLLTGLGLLVFAGITGITVDEEIYEYVGEEADPAVRDDEA